MRVLLADDNPLNLKLLEGILEEEAYDIIVAADGTEAAAVLRGPAPPALAILDWEMPGISGLDLCRQTRESSKGNFVYLILLTVRDSRSDMLEGFDAGADDYITKPFDRGELLARVRIGLRMARLQKTLEERVRELEDALAQVRELEGIIPICGYCKKIRDDQNFWHRVEDYIARRSRATFSHGFCPECYERHIKPELDRLEVSRKAEKS